MRDNPHGGRQLSHAAFTSLVDTQQHRLLAFLQGIIGRPEPAFDLVQDTFYDAWRSAQRGDAPFVLGTPEDEVRRWLFRAGYNNAISWLRRKRLIHWESLEQIDEPHTPMMDVPLSFEDQLAEGDALQSALRQLSPPDVACLLLRVVHGFSAAETGLILHTSADNVNTRLARAKQRLRAAYFQHTVSEEQHR